MIYHHQKKYYTELDDVPMAWLSESDPVIKAAMSKFKGNDKAKKGKSEQPSKCVRFDLPVAPKSSLALESSSSSSHSSSCSYSSDTMICCARGEEGRVLTAEERLQVWYTKKEIAAMRQDKTKAREWKLKKDTDDFSVRGMEDAVSSKVNKQRKARRAAVIQSVLQEQARQKKQNDFLVSWDVEKLRKKSRSVSKEATKIAVSLAVLDAEEVRGAQQGWSGSATWSRRREAATKTSSMSHVLESGAVDCIQIDLTGATSWSVATSTPPSSPTSSVNKASKINDITSQKTTSFDTKPSSPLLPMSPPPPLEKAKAAPSPKQPKSPAKATNIEWSRPTVSGKSKPTQKQSGVGMSSSSSMMSSISSMTEEQLETKAAFMGRRHLSLETPPYNKSPRIVIPASISITSTTTTATTNPRRRRSSAGTKAISSSSLAAVVLPMAL